MRYTIEDLIALYAEYNEMSVEEASEQYAAGQITRCGLLEAYLHDEGLYGYTGTLWSIFEAFASNP